MATENEIARNETKVNDSKEAQTETTNCHAGGVASPLAVHVAPLPNHLLHVQKAEMKPILTAVLNASGNNISCHNSRMTHT